MATGFEQQPSYRVQQGIHSALPSRLNSMLTSARCAAVAAAFGTQQASRGAAGAVRFGNFGRRWRAGGDGSAAGPGSTAPAQWQLSAPARHASTKASKATPKKRVPRKGKGKLAAKAKAAGTGLGPPAGQGHSASQIEQTYQRKTAVEHVLLRPGMYIGAVEPQEGLMWVYNRATHSMQQKELQYSAAICKVRGRRRRRGRWR